MTKDQFLRNRYNHMPMGKAEAHTRALDFNMMVIEGHTVVAAQAGDHWCLTLQPGEPDIPNLGISKPTEPCETTLSR